MAQRDIGSINCWSGPRCCSTSLMYSFAQRTDTEVLDEPLYANYLRITGLPRPYLAEVFKSQENDGVKVVRERLLGPRRKKYLYAKHMAKQKIGLDNGVFKQAQNMILVREPYGVLQSFSKVLEPTQQELGYTALLEILSELRVVGQQPIVVISDDLVLEPEGMLCAICAALQMPFDPAMLSWAAGPKLYDGIWAPWWYQNTHKSTGFSATIREARSPLPDRFKPLLGECHAMFELLRAYALKPLSDDIPRNPAASAAIATAAAATSATAVASAVDGAHSGLDSLAASSQAGARPQDAPQPQADVAADGPCAVNVEKSSHSQKSGTHVYAQDARNADILIGMRNGVLGTFELVWRPQAKVSVLDSGYMLGDGVWEGIRLHQGVLMFIEEHLDRLYEGAKAIDMDLDMSQAKLQSLIYEMVDANGMANASGVHIRLMVTRGLKPTPYQSPYITIGKPTIVIIPEYKEAAPGPKQEGIRLFTCHVRRGAPDVQEPMWNSHSKLNCIAACIQAKQAGVEEALMLDPHGFVATCNSVNFFCVRRSEVWAPTRKYQLHGITRHNVIQLCLKHGIPVRELDFTLTQVYSAEEAFVTGTFAGLIPVKQVDGRTIGDGSRGPLTARLQQLYMDMMVSYASQGRRHL